MNIELPSKLMSSIDPTPRDITFSYFYDVDITQLRRTGIFAKRLTSFTTLVLIVLILVASKQMVEIHAARIIASMKDVYTNRKLPEAGLPQESVRPNFGIIDVELTIAVFIYPTHPTPALPVDRMYWTKEVDLIPKPFNRVSQRDSSPVSLVPRIVGSAHFLAIGHSETPVNATPHYPPTFVFTEKSQKDYSKIQWKGDQQ